MFSIVCMVRHAQTIKNMTILWVVHCTGCLRRLQCGCRLSVCFLPGQRTRIRTQHIQLVSVLFIGKNFVWFEQSFWSNIVKTGFGSALIALEPEKRIHADPVWQPCLCTVLLRCLRHRANSHVYFCNFYEILFIICIMLPRVSSANSCNCAVCTRMSMQSVPQSRQSAKLSLQSSERLPPAPSPPLFPRGWETLACGRGGGGANSDEGRDTLAL